MEGQGGVEDCGAQRERRPDGARLGVGREGGSERGREGWVGGKGRADISQL